MNTTEAALIALKSSRLHSRSFPSVNRAMALLISIASERCLTTRILDPEPVTRDVERTRLEAGCWTWLVTHHGPNPQAPQLCQVVIFPARISQQSVYDQFFPLK